MKNNNQQTSVNLPTYRGGRGYTEGGILISGCEDGGVSLRSSLLIFKMKTKDVRRK